MHAAVCLSFPSPNHSILPPPHLTRVPTIPFRRVLGSGGGPGRALGSRQFSVRDPLLSLPFAFALHHLLLHEQKCGLRLLGETKQGELEHGCRLPVPCHEVSLSPVQAMMAGVTSAVSEVEMEEPICLVENHAGQGLAVRQEALQVLANITQPVVVVAITGLYRSGKSYLMNRLAGQRTGEGRGGMGSADPMCPRCWDSPPLRFMLSNPISPTQVSPWAPTCRVRPKESGCGACLTPASPATRWCCWTPRGWETWTRSGRSSAFPPCNPSACRAVGRAACTSSSTAVQFGRVVGCPHV